MAQVLSLVNGVPKMVQESAATTIYDEHLTVISGTAGANEVSGPISTGSPVTLPGSKSYTGEELEVYLGGQRLEDVFDYNHNTSTTVTFTFDLEVGDRLRFRIDRPPE